MNDIQEIVRVHRNVQSHVFNKEPEKGDREGVDYVFV